jgi:CRP/FNR family transcriptional regulator, cyclic AMP receptor protein
MKFFRNVFLFQGLNDRMRAVLVHSMVEKTYGQGESIFEQGDVGRAFFVVAGGKVQLQRAAKDGTPEALAELGPGDFFGEMVLLDELPRSASARAMEPTTVYILYKSTFDTLLVDEPHAASKFLHALARLLSARLRRDVFHAENGDASLSVAKPGLLKRLFR